MYIEYQFFFNEEKNFPSFIRDDIEEEAGGRYLIRISPDNEDKVWKKNSAKFLKYIKSAKAKKNEPWYTRVIYGAQEDKFTYKDYKDSKLFALDMNDYLGYDQKASYEKICPVCGKKNEDEINEVMIDEKTILSWKFGFTQTNRLILHIDAFEKLLKMNLSGYRGKIVRCNYPNDYIIKLWCGSLDKNRYLLHEYNRELPKGIKLEEWLDFTIMIVSKDIFNSNDFKEFDKYLSFLDDKDELDYKLISPARKVANLLECRWVELEIVGKAGSEIGLNDYNESVKCLLCGVGGLIPKDKLVMDYSSWDNSDFCKTDTGRICISKKAYDFLHDEWGILAEPIADIIK